MAHTENRNKLWQACCQSGGPHQISGHVTRKTGSVIQLYQDGLVIFRQTTFFRLTFALNCPAFRCIPPSEAVVRGGLLRLGQSQLNFAHEPNNGVSVAPSLSESRI